MAAPHRILYLHGFASSPRSQKATFLAGRLSAAGFEVEIPALDQNDFERITITRQLELVSPLLNRLSDRGPVGIIGSSLGGYLAALLAARHTLIGRVILLAPAFDFHRLWAAELGPERLSAWRERGTLEVYHYGAGRQASLGYGLMLDAEQYEPFPRFSQPALLFHGDHDPVVPIALSEHFVSTHPNSRLVRLPSGHELTDVLDLIWADTESFLTRAEL